MKNKNSDRAKRRKLERDVKNNRKLQTTPEETLFNLKYKFEENKQIEVINTFEESVFQRINGITLPKSYSELGLYGHTYKNNDFLKEIQWYTLKIKNHHEKLNSFLKLEDNIYSNILLGNYNEANKEIDYIDNNICFSHWSIEKKLIISENQTGFKKNKETLSNIINVKNQHLTNVLARYQSIRIEKNLSFVAYEEIVNEYIEKHKNHIQDLLNFKLNFYLNRDIINNGFILNALNGYSIIDNYNTFISLVSIFVSKREKNELEVEAIKKSLKSLSNLINDVRINNLLIGLDEIDDINLTAKNLDFIKITDFYTKGDYYDAKNAIEVFLKNDANCFDLYVLYIEVV